MSLRDAGEGGGEGLGQQRWDADYDPGAVDLIGTALRNKTWARGGERYPISEVWARLDVLLRSPRDFEEMRRVLSLGPQAVVLKSRRTIERRTREDRGEKAYGLLPVEQMAGLVRAMRELYELSADQDLWYNLMVDATAITPDGMAVAGKQNHGFIVVNLCFHVRAVPAFPIHVKVTDGSKMDPGWQKEEALIVKILRECDCLV
jgi:hypothetical protein